MNWPILYWLITMTAAAISVGLILHLRRSLDVGGAKTLVGMLAAVALWSGAYGFEYAGADLGTKLWWLRIEYIGVVAVPPLWFRFAQRFTRSDRRPSNIPFALSAVVSLVFLVLAWTNDLHGLFWTDIHLAHSPGGPLLLIIDRGTAFWIFVAYGYILLALGTALLIQAFLRSKRLIRQQLIVLFVGVGAPWLGNIVHISGLSPLPGLDTTPLGFTVFGLVLTFSLFRFKFLDVLPMAREAVIEGLGDPVVILDRQDRIMDYNAAAGKLFTTDAPPIGQPADQFLPDWNRLIEETGRPDSATAEVTWAHRANDKVYDLTISPLTNRKQQAVGRLVYFRDVTEKRRTEEDLKRTQEIYKLLAKNTADLISICDSEARFIYVSPSHELLLGYKEEELLGRPIYTSVHPDDLKMVLQAIEAAFQAGTRTPRSSTFRLVDKDGKAIWVESVGRLLFSSDDAIEGAVFNTRNITDRLKAEEALKESEKKYRELIENIDQGIYQLDESGVLTYVSPAATKIFGLPPEGVIGQPIFDFIHPDDLEEAATHLQEIMKGRSVSCEYRFRRASGDYCWVLAHGKPLIQKERVTGVQGAFSDISRRRLSEEALKDSEERYRTVVEESFDGLMLHDGQYVVFTNARAEAMLGYERGELVGLDFKYLAAPESYGIMKERAQARLRGESPPSRYEVRMVRQDGSLLDAEISARVITLTGQNFLQTWIRDVSERKLAEEALRESEERFAIAFRSTPGAISISHAPNGGYVDVNNGFTKMYGWEREGAIGRTSFDLNLWADPEAGRRRGLLLESQKAVRDYEFHFRRKSGEIGVALNAAEIIEIRGAPYILSISQDITDLKKAQEDTVRLAAAIEQAAEDIVITDTQGTILYVNPAFERISGYGRDEVLGQNPRLLKSGRHDLEFYREMWATIKAGRVWTGRIVNRSKDGRMIQLEATISPIYDSKGDITGFVSVKRDITEQIRLESQLRQSQKMEALGTLASGIAHDFNNILTIILGHTQMARKRMPDGEVGDSLGRIMAASLRAMNLVKGILTFTRQTEQERRPVDLRDVIEESLQLIGPSLPSTITIQKQVTADWAMVMADPTQLHQIMMNLCTNASYAMRESGGSLEIGLREIREGKTGPLQDDIPLRTPFLNLTISDTGSGIPTEIKDRIFDPYFTTKRAGEGTGLGLSMVHGIVESHGGAVRVYSEPNQGTTFHVYLPTLEKSDRPSADPLGDAEIPLARHGESILLVDDEVVLAEVGRDILESLGYVVDVRTDSRDALEVFRRTPDRYDLILTDLVMPGLSGFDLAAKVRKLRWDIPIIICTGLVTSANRQKTHELGRSLYLLKPFLVKELAGAVRTMLDGEPAGS